MSEDNYFHEFDQIQGKQWRWEILKYLNVLPFFLIIAYFAVNPNKFTKDDFNTLNHGTSDNAMPLDNNESADYATIHTRNTQIQPIGENDALTKGSKCDEEI